jgi:SAM-dependent methyltransferase
MIAPDLSYFDALYAGSDDPWSMQARWYERRKRALVMASLPSQRYACVFEPGCGAGHLTELLAERCERLLATDFSADAVRLARLRLQHAAHVEVQQRHAPRDWPAERFDLVVLSEFAFYLDDAELALLQQRSLAALDEDGVLLACHWRRPFAERIQDSEAIHAWFDREPALTRLSHHEEADFLLNVWGRQPLSAAQREGFA